MRSGAPLFYPAAARRPDTTIHLDGIAVPACTGETVIAALLLAGHMTGRSEFDGSGRSGFCLMGACQDCTLWTTSGQRLRACMAQVRPGLTLCRRAPIEDEST